MTRAGNSPEARGRPGRPWLLALAAATWAALVATPVAGEAPVAMRALTIARPGRAWSFPRDHGSHPDFGTEWWYVTGHLAPSGGSGARATPDRPPDPLGFQFTIFRSAIQRIDLARAPGRWSLPDVYLGHFALTDPSSGRFAYAERRARPGPGAASTADLDVRCEDWWLRREPGPPGSQGRLVLHASDAAGTLDLELVPRTAPVLHGQAGLHRKGACEECASHYVSFPRLAARGTLVSGGVSRAVSGEAWFDHEFMSTHLDRGQEGWDWTGLHLSDGSSLMAVRLRSSAGKDRCDGTWVGPDGTVRPLPLGSVAFAPLGTWTSPATGARYPIRMRVTSPALGLDLELEPALDGQELDTSASTGVVYWEGLVQARGTRGGRPVTAQGYLELTGYRGGSPLGTAR